MNKSYDAPSPFTEISERFDELMDVPIRTKSGDYVSSLTLADRAFQHPWFGRQLRTQPPRFGHRFDNDSPVVQYLGADADTNGHMYELMFHIATFLRAHAIDLSDEDRGILMFTAGIHDTDETTHDQIKHTCGGVTGDIPCGEKTMPDKRLQVRIRKMRDQHLFNDIPEETLRRVEAIIAHEDKTILGEIYDTVHEIQSLETTRIAKGTLASGNFRQSDTAALNEVAFDVNDNVRNRLAPLLSKLSLRGVDMAVQYESMAAA